MTGYIWNFSIYCGKGTGEIVDGLDHPGSLLVSLAAPLLNEGRLIVADNWYSSIPLAKYLQQRNTEYCGTLQKNRSGLPSQLKSTKVKKNDPKGVINSDGIRVVKYKDQRDVYMISTFHGVDTEETGRSNRHGEAISKPTVIIDYNRVKGGIDLSDQMIAYYSPARKSVKCFRKLLMECIWMAVVNSWVLCNRYYDGNNGRKMPLGSFVKRVAMSLLKIEDQAPVAHIGRQISHPHQLSTIPRRADGKITWKRCHGCYEKLSRQYGRKEATKKAKQVSTECTVCKHSFCLPCFNDKH